MQEIISENVRRQFGLPPHGSFRVVCPNLVEPWQVWAYGEHDSLKAARTDADEHTSNNGFRYMNRAYVYNHEGRIVHRGKV